MDKKIKCKMQNHLIPSRNQRKKILKLVMAVIFEYDTKGREI